MVNDFENKTQQKNKWINSTWLLDQRLRLQTVRGSSMYLSYKSILSSGRVSEKYQPIFKMLEAVLSFQWAGSKNSM